MKKIWEWIKLNPNRAMFLVPILLVAGISISHVVSWYNLANPISWAIYLSIAIEIGAHWLRQLIRLKEGYGLCLG